MSKHYYTEKNVAKSHRAILDTQKNIQKIFSNNIWFEFICEIHMYTRGVHNIYEKIVNNMLANQYLGMLLRTLEFLKVICYLLVDYVLYNQLLVS